MVYWCDSSSNSTAASNGSYYVNNTAATATISYYSTTFIPIYTYAPAPETDQQRIAREQREERDRVATLRIAKERQDAITAAESLLKENLDEQRWKEVAEKGFLHVDSAKYIGRKYKLSRYTHMIDVLEEDKVVDRLCIHFVGEYHLDCPADDRLLAQLVLLEADEELVLQTANHNVVR